MLSEKFHVIIKVSSKSSTNYQNVIMQDNSTDFESWQKTIVYVQNFIEYSFGIRYCRMYGSDYRQDLA
jgi:hypothetical protein